MKEVFRDNIDWINDLDTLREALVFIVNEKGRAEAQIGEHDDLIMGLAIAYYIRTQQRYSVEKIEKKEEIKLPFELMDNEIETDELIGW